MALLATRGLADFPNKIFDLAHKQWQHWLGVLCREFPRVRVYSVAINPTQVNANSESTQTFTVTGLATNDVIYLNSPALEAGIGIMYYRVSATDTLQVRFRNFTAGNIDPASGTWTIIAITN